MPMFNTGNAEWDQGFNTLASGLFPDPSKVAQAGYYGAEARKAQFDAAKSKEQLAAGHYLLGMTNGQQMRPPTTSASGPLDIQTLNEPQAPPGPPPNPPTLGGMMANSAAARPRDQPRDQPRDHQLPAKWARAWTRPHWAAWSPKAVARCRLPARPRSVTR